jgi:hypothetical protein
MVQATKLHDGPVGESALQLDSEKASLTAAKLAVVQFSPGPANPPFRALRWPFENTARPALWLRPERLARLQDSALHALLPVFELYRMHARTSR